MFHAAKWPLHNTYKSSQYFLRAGDNGVPWGKASYINRKRLNTIPQKISQIAVQRIYVWIIFPYTIRYAEYLCCRALLAIYEQCLLKCKRNLLPISLTLIWYSRRSSHLLMNVCWKVLIDTGMYFSLDFLRPRRNSNKNTPKVYEHSKFGSIFTIYATMRAIALIHFEQNFRKKVLQPLHI